MKVGDLVIYAHFGLEENEYEKSLAPGIVLSIQQWVDSGAPNKNFGINVEVLWNDGRVSFVEECDLDYYLVSEIGETQ